MDNAFPILAAITVICLAWGVWQVAASIFDPEKKKLAQRLAGEPKLATGANPAGAMLRHTEAAGLSAMLARYPVLKEINRQLIQTWPDMSLTTFLSISGISLVVAVFIGAALVDSVLLCGFIALLAGYGPFLVLSTRRARRQKAIVQELPEALDFLSRVLRAGHSLSTGVQMMGEELPEPLASEFRRCYDQHSLGQPLEEALRDTSVRVESPDFGFFVTAVLIQRQTGGDLSEVLGNISGMIRGRIRLQQHVLAKTAEGRFTGYILVAFPILMFIISYVMNPAYAGILLHTSTGMYMLGTAGGLIVMGLICIRRITTIKV
jgi:tight adherence protein B